MQIPKIQLPVHLAKLFLVKVVLFPLGIPESSNSSRNKRHTKVTNHHSFLSKTPYTCKFEVFLKTKQFQIHPVWKLLRSGEETEMKHGKGRGCRKTTWGQQRTNQSPAIAGHPVHWQLQRTSASANQR